MAAIRITTLIRAPMERCFDLSRSVEVHLTSTAFSGERAVAGVTSGLMSLGQEVTWQARHLGIAQLLSTRITVFDRPHHFRDSMVRGAFRRFDHDHYFEAHEHGSTLMTDVFDFNAPLGALGRLAERLFLTGHMERLLITRNETIRQLAETEEWQKYLATEG